MTRHARVTVRRAVLCRVGARDGSGRQLRKQVSAEQVGTTTDDLTALSSEELVRRFNDAVSVTGRGK